MAKDSRDFLAITGADKTEDGRVRVTFSDRSYCVLTLADVLSAGLFHVDREQPKAAIVRDTRVLPIRRRS